MSYSNTTIFVEKPRLSGSVTRKEKGNTSSAEEEKLNKCYNCYGGNAHGMQPCWKAEIKHPFYCSFCQVE